MIEVKVQRKKDPYVSSDRDGEEVVKSFEEFALTKAIVDAYFSSTYGVHEKWSKTTDGWLCLPKEFYWHIAGQEGEAPWTTSYFPKFQVKWFASDNILVIRFWADREKDTTYLFCRVATAIQFSMIEIPKNCKLDGDGRVTYEIERGRVTKFEVNHPAWPRMLADPEKYRSLAILEYLVTPDKLNPLSVMLRDNREGIQFAGESLRNMLEEARDLARTHLG